MEQVILAVQEMHNLVTDIPSIRSQLTALTPHDGRYVRSTYALSNFCSEAGLQRLRTLVEIEYLIYYCQDKISVECVGELRMIYKDFTVTDAERIKRIEKDTNHDVKAVEYFICEKLDEMGRADLEPRVHIYLTSEDVTNAAIGMMVHLVYDRIMRKELTNLLHTLMQLAQKWKHASMLARTHGQPASPTTVGKEFAIYASRIGQIIDHLDALPIKIKWNGASGNYNAHTAFDCERDWIEFSRDFIAHLGFDAELYTAQTNHYLYLADILHQYKNLCSVLIDLCVDVWLYISYDNFKLKLKEGEVGSSVMPHKVNPIDFENAEGNLGLAEINFGYLASKLQKSRMQRDLSDSTTLRNLGVHFGSFLIGVKSILRGLGKIDINEKKLMQDLNDNPAVLAEAIQSVMRAYNVSGAYERLKEVTRGKSVDLKILREFISSLKGELPDVAVEYLLCMVPGTYTGIAGPLTDHFLNMRK